MSKSWATGTCSECNCTVVERIAKDNDEGFEVRCLNTDCIHGKDWSYYRFAEPSWIKQGAIQCRTMPQKE